MYVGDQLVYEKRGTTELYFWYDSYGHLAVFRVYYADGTNALYYALTNAQGDVLGLYNGNGDLRVSYEYDTWGNIVKTTDSSGKDIATLNPIRYRGYYYDVETGLYYLQSRYYDPQIGRFINADGYVSTGQSVLGNNMFAYCGNNSVNMIDPSGCCYGYANHPDLDSPFSGVRFGYNCGAYGAHARRPRTKDASVTDAGYSSDGNLSNEQMHVNAEIIYNYLAKKGWSLNSICAVLGNMQHESITINPGCWQAGGGGYGIVQWDPASKYLDWASCNGFSSTSAIGQTKFLIHSMQPGEGEWFDNGKGCYLSYVNFISSDAPVAYLTEVFMWSYERPGVPHLDRRVAHAEYWYTYFS